MRRARNTAIATVQLSAHCDRLKMSLNSLMRRITPERDRATQEVCPEEHRRRQCEQADDDQDFIGGERLRIATELQMQRARLREHERDREYQPRHAQVRIERAVIVRDRMGEDRSCRRRHREPEQAHKYVRASRARVLCVSSVAFHRCASRPHCARQCPVIAPLLPAVVPQAVTAPVLARQAEALPTTSS